jgi:hypothetical protein
VWCMQWGKKVRKILVRRNCKVNVGLGKEMCGECTEEKFRKDRRMRLEKLEKIFLKFCGQAHIRDCISLVTVVCSSLPPVPYWDRLDLHECKCSCTHSQKV